MFGIPDVDQRLDAIEESMQSMNANLSAVVELLTELLELERARDNRVECRYQP